VRSTIRRLQSDLHKFDTNQQEKLGKALALTSALLPTVLEGFLNLAYGKKYKEIRDNFSTSKRKNNN